MRRPKLPAFIHAVIDERRRRGILVAATLALFAVGLVPRVLSPGLPTAQVALRSQSEIQNVFLLLAFASTASVILGGLVRPRCLARPAGELRPSARRSRPGRG